MNVASSGYPAHQLILNLKHQRKIQEDDITRPSPQVDNLQQKCQEYIAHSLQKHENKTWECCCNITFKWLTNQKSHWPATHAHIVSKWFRNFRKHGCNAYPNESKFQRLEAWIYERIEIGGLHVEWNSVRIWIHPKAKNFFEVVQHGKLSWFWGIEDTIAVNGKEGKWEYLLTPKCHC